VAIPATLSNGKFDQLSKEFKPVVEHLHNDVAKLARTEEFRRYLESIDALLAKAGTDPISGRRFASVYLGGEQADQHLPICYGYDPGGGSETARTGLSTDKGACNPDGKTTVAFTTLRSVTIERAQSSVTEAKACAVNTVAHEWAHAIATTTANGNGHTMVFEDGDHDHQRGAVASYVVGAVAQCLYLKQAYNFNDFDVAKCVEAVGTNGFDPSTCVDGWAMRFAAKPQVGLCD
jgi:hypothetical protein